MTPVSYIRKPRVRIDARGGCHRAGSIVQAIEREIRCLAEIGTVQGALGSDIGFPVQPPAAPRLLAYGEALEGGRKRESVYALQPLKPGDASYRDWTPLVRSENHSIPFYSWGRARHGYLSLSYVLVIVGDVLVLTGTTIREVAR